MGMKELIGTLAIGAALGEQMVNTPTRSRRMSEHTHFTPSEWQKRKKRNKAQRAARKITRKYAK